MKVIKTKDYDEMSQEACKIIVEKINQLFNPVLGLATGSTPEGLYQYLIEQYKQKKVSFKNAMTFNLDEYVGLAEENKNSYHFYMNDKLFNHIDIQRKNAYVPNGVAEDLQRECETFEQLIANAGGIDLQLLGLGINGHIGFNEPGTPFTSRTHVVRLDESTRNANSHFFASKGEVPNKAISMGIATIMESKEIILLVSGEKKAEALKKLLTGEVNETFPASVLHEHENVTVIADEAALSKVENL